MEWGFRTRKNIILKFLITIFVVCLTFLSPKVAFADGGATDGGNASGGTCTMFCTGEGVSWQKYEITEKPPEGGLTVSYHDNMTGPIYIKHCKKGMTVYNFGIEAFDPEMKYYQVGTIANGGNTVGKWADWIYSSNYGFVAGQQYLAKGSFVNGTNDQWVYNFHNGNIQNYTTPVGYATPTEAEEQFGKLFSHAVYVGPVPGIVVADGYLKNWRRVGAFCWSDKYEAVYFAQSKAKITVNGKTKAEADTGVRRKDRYEVADGGTIEKETAETVTATVTFTHNLYSTEKVEKKHEWNRERADSVEYSNAKIKLTTSGDGNGKTRGSTEFTELSSVTPSYEEYINKKLFTADTRYAGNNLLETSYEVTFKPGANGKYEFCETLSTEQEEDEDGTRGETLETTACVSVNIKEAEASDGKYYAQSKAKISIGGSTAEADTGVRRKSRPAAADAGTIEKNDTGTITATVNFVHNLYSSEKVTEAHSWNRTKANNATYSNVTMSSGSGNGQTTGSTKFTKLSSVRPSYAGDSNIQLYDADTRYAGNNLLETSYIVTFKAGASGTYEFCETLSTGQVGKNGNTGTLETTACVSVTIKTKTPESVCNPSTFPTPSSYTASNLFSGTTSTISKVKNNSLTNEYKNYSELVYAKPTDNVEWCNAYYPGVQKAAGATVTPYNLDLHPATVPDPNPTSGGDVIFIDSYNNQKFLDYPDWRNGFNISSANVNPSYSKSATYSKGDATPRADGNKADVKTGQAGKTLSETITSSSPATASVTGEDRHPWSCNLYVFEYECIIEEATDEHEAVWGVCYLDQWDTCFHDEDFYRNSHSGTASSTSRVYVPYNFRNTAEVELQYGSVYAGETVKISSSRMTVHTKQNNTTQGTYATQVDQAQTKLVGYVSSSNSGAEKTDHASSNICSALPVKNGSCDDLKSYSGRTFNSSANMDGSTENLGFAGQSYNVYDAKAGDYFCVVVAVYPSTSGDDKNMNASGDNKWYVSAPSCRLIAKRPSFQVWGGSLYSAGSVNTSNAEKNNLAGVYAYTPQSKGDTVVFGSWVEQSVVANGIVKGLASGAATGEVTAKHRSGSKEGAGVKYCKYRVPLSIANYTTSLGGQLCPSTEQVGNANLANAAVDRDALESYWSVENVDYTINYTKNNPIDIKVDFRRTTTIEGNQVNYTISDKDQVSLSGTTIAKGNTHVMKAKNIRIDGNIVYEDTTYQSEKDIPKVLIYASGDITISCNVTRIDAILVAQGKVTTCDSTINLNSAANSKYLQINGMVMADKLELTRTYGARMGVESGVPAEVVNYDTSAILWGKSMATTTDSDTLTTVYQHEIAPRY